MENNKEENQICNACGHNNNDDKKEHICNMCGNSCTLGKDEFKDNKCGLIDAKVRGGYESTPGNGWGALDDVTEYKFTLCEFCLDWLFVKFKIPVDVFYMGEKEDWRPAAQRVTEDDWRTFKKDFFDEAAKRDEARRK